MAGSVNKVILVGNLGNDPEIRRTQDGRPIANLAIATSENWRDKETGERKEKTEWHRVVIFSEGAVPGRRAIFEKGRQGIYRGRAADPQMDRQGRRREVLDRSRAAGLQSTLTMLDGRSGGGGDDELRSGIVRRRFRQAARSRRRWDANRQWQAAADKAAIWTTRFRSDRRAIRRACVQGASARAVASSRSRRLGTSAGKATGNARSNLTVER